MNAFTPETVAWRDRLAYGFSCFGKDIVFGAVSAIIFVYCTSVLKISLTFLGILYLSHHLLGALCSPFLGELIDHSKSRIGKYKPYIIIGTILNICSLACFGFLDEIPDNWQHLYLAVIYLMWSGAYFISDVPLWAVLSLFNANVATRDSMAAIPSMSNFISRQLLLIGVLPIIANIPQFLEIYELNFPLVFILSSLILIVSQGSFVLFLKTSDYEQTAIKEHFIPQNKNGFDVDVTSFNRGLYDCDYRNMESSELYNTYLLEHTNRSSMNNVRAFYDQIARNEHAYSFDPAHAYKPKLSFWHKLFNTPWIKVNPLRQAKHMSSIIFHNDQLLVLFSCSILLNTMVGVVLGALVNFFVDKHMFQDQSLYFIVLLGILLQCFSMASFEALARHVPRSWILTTSVIIAIISFAAIKLAPVGHELFYACIAGCIFAGNICIGLCRVAVSSMTIDTVDYGEFKLNLRSGALIFAMRSMAKHLGLVISFFCYGGAVSFSYYFHNGSQLVPDISFNWAIAIVAILGLTVILIFTLHYKLNGAFYRNILNNLQYLRQNQSFQYNQANHFMLRYSLDESTMIIKLQVHNEEQLIKALVQKLAKVNAITSEFDYLHDLKVRLSLGPCGIAEGIAFPHAKSSAVRRPTVVVATLDEPLDLGALDNRKCDLVFLLASPDDGETHLNLLGRLSLLLNEPGFADKLRSSGSPTELFERLIQCEKHVVN